MDHKERSRWPADGERERGRESSGQKGDKEGERRKSRDRWDMGEGALNFVSIDGVA